MTICDPADGSIIVERIEVAGNSDDPIKYTYFVYNSNTNTDNLILTHSGSSVIPGISAGIYYVIAEENILGTKSDPVMIEVFDGSVKPFVQLEELKPQTKFNPDPAYHNGSISISVNGTNDLNNYQVIWFKGTGISGNHLSEFDNQLKITHLTVSSYTVWVKDKTTNCETIKSFYIPDEKQNILLITSSAPNTNCVDPNGRASVRIVNEIGSYHYYWYKNADGYPDEAPDYQGKLISNSLEAGEYYVVAFDTDDPDNVAKALVTVGEILEYPEIEIFNDHPLTNCDPQRANGSMLAKVNGNNSYFIVDWYQLPEKEKSIGQGYNIFDLSSGTYQSSATNRITGCRTISNMLDLSIKYDSVPLPNALVLHHMTNCESPNGMVSASIDNSRSFSYLWFQNEIDEEPEYNNAAITGLNYDSYYVIAEDLLSGCRSGSVMIEVLDQRVYPEFLVNVVNATCFKENGAASISILNNVNVGRIIWDLGWMEERAVEIFNKPAGLYNATLKTFEGCSSSKDFEIGSDVQVYKGVSPNGDGRNDWFIVDCIEDYPENAVKIFNRAGTLVYETENYSNDINHFEGYGNRGIYLGNKELPIGTYFYIINLKNGDSPLTGYLELVR